MTEQQAKPETKKWYQQDWAIIVFLVVFFPVGLYLMWKYANWSKVAKWIVTASIGVLVVISMANPQKTGTTTQPPAEQNKQAEQPKATPKPPKKSSQEIYDQVQVGMTREEVVSIAGREPENCTNSEIAGLGASSICSYGTTSIIFIENKVNSKTKL